MTDQEPAIEEKENALIASALSVVYVRKNSIPIIKIIMPKLCIKDRKLLSLWYVSVIRVSLLFQLRGVAAVTEALQIRQPD